MTARRGNNPSTTDQLRIRVLPSIADVPASVWDACANPDEPAPSAHFDAKSMEVAAAAQASCERANGSFDPAATSAYNPFISHAFLSALEASGSATAKTGWMPQHLMAERGGDVIGVVPCYLKTHSRGEYVFDRGWAEAYEHAGGSYYPKLQVSVPFTPATGRRLLVRAGVAADETREALAQGLVELCQLRRASSAHITFMPESEWDFVGQHGYLQRTPDPHDGRRQLISLTETGVELIEGTRREREEWVAGALATDFTEDERQTILTALVLLDRLAEK